MDVILRSEMAGLLRTLMECPGARIFIDPVVLGEDCHSDYLDIVPHPTSLRENLTKLEQNAYASQHDLLQEIECC